MEITLFLKIVVGGGIGILLGVAINAIITFAIVYVKNGWELPNRKR